MLDPSAPEAKKFASEAALWVVGDDGTEIVKGRMKFCRPVLRAANRADPEATQKTFLAYRNSFHPIARRLIEKVRLHFSKSTIYDLIIFPFLKDLGLF